MVDERILQERLGELADRVARLRQLCPPDAGALRSDQDRLELVSFNLVLALQACVDIASHLVADEEWTPARSLADAFDRLQIHGVISSGTANELAAGARLRNRLVHSYATSDPALIHAAATTGLRYLDAFARECARWIRSRSG